MEGTNKIIIQNIKYIRVKRKNNNSFKLAFDLGFDQPTYFTEVFQKQQDLIPQQFQAIIPTYHYHSRFTILYKCYYCILNSINF
jgi:AraC-like DNA-binding protein